jgi:ribosomal protein L15
MSYDNDEEFKELTFEDYMTAFKIVMHFMRTYNDVQRRLYSELGRMGFNRNQKTIGNMTMDEWTNYVMNNVIGNTIQSKQARLPQTRDGDEIPEIENEDIINMKKLTEKIKRKKNIKVNTNLGDESSQNQKKQNI